MPFITQGKTNWKYILIVVILAVIVGGGTLSYWWAWREEVKILELKVPKEEVKMSEEKKPEELKPPALKVKDLKIKWKGELECGEEIIWAKVIDIDNDGENEMIISCSLADKIFIFKWRGDNFIVPGELPKEIEINPWRKYEVRSEDFGGIYHPGRVELNMIYSPSGGVPSQGENEETIWVKIETYEWDSFYKWLQFKTIKSLLGGSFWYIGDVNNDAKDDLMFFARPDPEKESNSYFIRVISWDGEKFVPIGTINLPELWSRGEVFIADTDNNGIKEIIIEDWGGWWYLYGGVLYYRFEWNGESFVELDRIDKKLGGKHTSENINYTFYKLNGVDDFDGDGENELITQLLPYRSQPQAPLGKFEGMNTLVNPFFLSVFKWNKEKNIYEEILVRDFVESGFEREYGTINFLDIGDIDNDGVVELIFKDKKNNLILFSYEEIPEEVIMDKQKLAEDIVEGYVKALMSRNREEVLLYLTGEARERVQKWPIFFGNSNPYLGSFDILGIKKLDSTEFEFVVREYEEYTGEGIIGYKDETIIVAEVNGKYLINTIKTGAYVDISNTENWNVYTNEKFGYEIRYPSGVFVQIPGFFTENLNTSFKISPEESVTAVNEQAAITIQIGQNPERLGLQDWVYSSYNAELKKEGWCIQEVKNILRLTSSCDYHTWEWKYDLISSGTKVIIISTVGSSKKINLFDISEKMLSTFKFLD